MKNKLKKIILNRWFVNVIVPIALFIFAAIGILFIVSPISFSLLTYAIKTEIVHQPQNNILFKGESFSEKFVARDNNLGIISIPFSSTNKVDYTDEDTITFTLNDVKSKKIVYQNTYRSGVLINSEYFPFGFPKISDSKNKEYLVTITSLKGNNNNALRVLNDTSTNQVSYDFAKREIIGSPTSLVSFLEKKYIQIFSSSETLYTALEYILPFIFYSLLIFARKKENGRPYAGELLIAFIIVYDIIFIPNLYSLILFVVLIVWICLANWHRLESTISYFFSLVLFVISLFAQYIHLISVTDKASVWGYFFLLIGTFQLLREVYNDEKKQVTLKAFINQLR